MSIVLMIAAYFLMYSKTAHHKSCQIQLSDIDCVTRPRSTFRTTDRVYDLSHANGSCMYVGDVSYV